MQVELPKVLNALLAVICDVYVLKLASHLYGPKAGGLAVSCTYIFGFYIYTSCNIYYLNTEAPMSFNTYTFLPLVLIFVTCML